MLWSLSRCRWSGALCLHVIVHLCVCGMATGRSALPPVVPIGALFETGDENLLRALQTAIDRINRSNMFATTKLELLPFFIKPNDSFNSARMMCQMLREQVWAIFSSRSESVGWYARSLANELHVPHLSVYWDYRAKSMYNINHVNNNNNKAQAQGDAARTNTVDRGGQAWLDLEALKGIGIPSGYARDGRQTPFTPQGPANKGLSDYELQQLNLYVDSQRNRAPDVANMSFTISLYPDPNQLAKAYSDLVVARNWKSFTIVYDQDSDLIKVRDLLRISHSFSQRQLYSVKISVIKFDQHYGKRDKREDYELVDFEEDRQHDRSRREHHSMRAEEGNQYKKLMKDIRKTEHNLVLALPHHKVLKVLREARTTKRMTEYSNFLITSMDIHTMDLSEFAADVVANITGFSMLSPKGQPIDLGDEQIYDRFLGASGGPHPHPNPWTPVVEAVAVNQHVADWQYPVLTTTEALIYDAITLFAQTLGDLDRTMPGEIAEPHLACNVSAVWPFGARIVKHMQGQRIKGVTGLLMFDQFGQRVNFTMDVLQLKPHGLTNIAKWTPEFGVKSNANYTFYDSYIQILEAMKHKELHVTVPPSLKPYIYLKANHTEEVGNDKFEGFCVDLLNMIAEVFRNDFASDFRFVIKIVPDLKFGQPDKETGDWDGMFGQLMRHQADLAIADLTATYLRETVVDFTMPFMNLGITILFKKPTLPEPELFSFLKPFSNEVWLYLASAYLGVSLLLWILSRISPYEWISPQSCDPEPLELVNEFSIGNSLWFTIGSLMQQGSDIAPKALSTRILASVWWFFTLIIISSYTANLAASLTLSMMSPAISNVEDLAKQTAIQYGCKRGGSTYEFFQNSNHSTYQRMFNTMESNPEVYINKMDDAIERVRKGGYAYLAESSTIEYLVQRQCDVYQVGTWLDNKGYGIATPADSPYRTPISNAIVVLQDRGLLYDLKKKWWVQRGGGLCVEGEIKMALDLDIANVGGVFLVLVAGAAIGVICGILEFVWKSLKISRHERESVGKLIWLEVLRICTGGGSSRPVYTAPVASAAAAENKLVDKEPEYGINKVPTSSSLASLGQRPEGGANDYGGRPGATSLSAGDDSLYSNVRGGGGGFGPSRMNSSPLSVTTHHTTPY